MRNSLTPITGVTCAFALAITGCSGTGSSPSALAYAPYVSATEASDTDSAGSPSAYNLAFVISDGRGCVPKWNGTEAIGDSAVKSRTARLRKDGADVRVSFGGASGKELAATCDSAEELAAAYGKALDAAGSSRADFDIEGDELADSASVARRSQAIARLQRQRPGLKVSFTLPVMPSGLDAGGLALLASANRYDVQVATVNLMTMNYGESYTGDMGDYAVASAEAAHAQLKKVFGLSDAGAWQGMALTSMIGVNGGDVHALRRGAGPEVRGAEGDRLGVDVVRLPGPAVYGRGVRGGRRGDRLRRGESGGGGVRGGVRGLR